MTRFKKIALAATFSPRFLPLLAEARRLVQKLNCEFLLIHSGEDNEENRARFDAAFNELSISPRPAIHWTHSDDPAGAILKTIREQGIDLLIAGALEKETPGRHYVGNVARILMRDAPCSLLLFTTPSVNPEPFRKIVTVTDFSPLSALSLEHTYFMASQNCGERIYLVRIFTIFAQVHAQQNEFVVEKDARQSLLEAEERRIAEFAGKVGSSPVGMETKCVEGTTGFAASDFVQAVDADLLVIPSHPPGTPQLLPDGMDWVFNVIPSNLFIVRQ